MPSGVQGGRDLKKTEGEEKVKPIIRIRKRAARYLRRLLACQAQGPNQCLRLLPAPGGQAGLVLDRAREGDEVIEVDGAPVLLLDPTLAPILRGATLDCEDTPEGSQLTLVK